MLDTPWARTADEKQDAVAGFLPAFGAGPTFLRLGMPRPDGAVTGIYGPDGSAVAGFSVTVQSGDPCGRIASLKLSSAGTLAAHLLERVGGAQTFHRVVAAQAPSLFRGTPAFVWPSNVMGGASINDMWFSERSVAANIYGSIWVGDFVTGVPRRAADLPGAEPGDYYTAHAHGDDLFVARKVESRTEWWVRRGDGLERFLSYPDRDVRELVTDGNVLVWTEGTGPEPAPPDSPFPTRYSRYSLMKSRYATRSSEIVPEVLVPQVPNDLGYLIPANGRVVGIYLISYPVYRAGAVVVNTSDGSALRSELPDGYSWGYGLYPAEDALLGPVTPGPMITFETVARVPYGTMQRLAE